MVTRMGRISRYLEVDEYEHMNNVNEGNRAGTLAYVAQLCINITSARTINERSNSENVVQESFLLFEIRWSGIC